MSPPSRLLPYLVWLVSVGAISSCGGKSTSDDAQEAGGGASTGGALGKAGGSGSSAGGASSGAGGGDISSSGGASSVRSGGEAVTDNWGFAGALSAELFEGSCLSGQFAGDFPRREECSEEFDGDPDEGASRWCGHLVLSPDWADFRQGERCPRADDLLGVCVRPGEDLISYYYEEIALDEASLRETCDGLLGVFVAPDEL